MSEQFDHPGGLIAALVQQNYNDYASTMTKLGDAWQLEAALHGAEVELIRERIYHLLEGQYTPSGYAIEKALFPSAENIEHRARQNHPEAFVEPEKKWEEET